MTTNYIPSFLRFTLKSLRVRKGETLKEASKALGVSIPTLTKWEEDSREITFGDIEKIEKHYNIPRDYIFFGTDYGFSEEITKDWNNFEKNNA